MEPLAGQQRKALRLALISAFPSYADLELLLDEELGRSLANISQADIMPNVVHRVIKTAESQGWTPKLVTAARIANPENPRLRQLVDSGVFDAELAVRKLVDDPTEATARDLLPQSAVLSDFAPNQLQKVVNAAVGFQNTVAWAMALIEKASRVCLVEVVTATGTTSGTGFLVGPDLVLTNHHVLAEVLDVDASPSGVRCRFDFHVRADGTVDHGKDYALAANWRLAVRPHSAVDTEVAPAGLPDAHELDYALVRLAASPGSEPVPGRDRRGWFDLRQTRPELVVAMPLIIIQHPAGTAVKHAQDTLGILSVNANGTRVTYGVNTLGGSSGSPCFTFSLDLVALHHAGAPEFSAGRNEGVPIAAITQDLTRIAPTALAGA